MDVEVFGSSSKGNCYALRDGKVTILLECGLTYTETVNRLSYQKPDAIVITHEHIDHSKSVKKFIHEYGVDTYMTKGTSARLKLNHRHNVHTITAYEDFYVCGHKFMAFPVKHDALEPVGYIIDDEILFATDLGTPPDINGHYKLIFIEANYDRQRLLTAHLSTATTYRISENHMSIAQTRKYLRERVTADEIHLIHISETNGSRREFVESVKLATNNNEVYAH